MERKKPGKVGENKSQIVREIPLACADEHAAVEFMEKQRWGDSPCCPCCGSVDVYKMSKRGSDEREQHFRWRCRDCASLYSVRKGTVFEDSRIPMRHWCFAFWAACSSKKGVSAKQIQRQTGLSYKSALFLMHRIRFAMSEDKNTQEKLSGIVEVDETYIGGKPRHKGWKAGAPKPRAQYSTKTRVVAMVERGGSVRAEVAQTVTSRNLRQIVLENVCTSSRLMTDELKAYRKVGPEYASHETVNHSSKEYSRGDVTTNTIEGFFSIVKRGLYGTYHSVSKKHLHRYMDEFAFRYNARNVDDGERTRLALQGAIGKRLMYHDPIGR